MCGVVALFSYASHAPPPSLRELRLIRDHMAHRGPDAAGEWSEPRGRLLLGHRRLSIIDLNDRANQPMHSADGRYTVVFNGEIYNHRVLRRELEQGGSRFRTTSDTEVLLHLYAQRGPAMVDALRGMFAFALWDAIGQTLFLARDPLGIKPLYYADDGGTLRVASQVKSLLAGKGLDAGLDAAGMVGFLLLGSVPEPFTLHRQIRALPAGHWMMVRPDRVEQPRQYFSLASLWRDAADASPTVSDAVAESMVAEAVRDSIQHHLESDVPVGCFLSAGVDSGSLLGMAYSSGQTLRSITLKFEEFCDLPEDESVLAVATARSYHSPHTLRTVQKEEFLAEIPQVLQAMDQPSIDGINTWFVSKAAREQGLKVAISGLGGDELFGGYSSFQDLPKWVRSFSPLARIPGFGSMVRHILTPILPRGLSPKMAGMVLHGGSWSGAYLLRRGLFMPWELPALLGNDLAQKGLERLCPFAIIDSVLDPDPLSSHARVAALEGSLYMRNQLLRDTDWASMAHSLEVRVPLVDVELIRRLAPLMIHALGPSGKRLLAAAPSPPLPVSVVNRPKTGFSVPFASWIQEILPNHSRRRKRRCLFQGGHWSRRWAIQVGRSMGIRILEGNMERP
ncbi:MAG: asparagine synthase (glutamine-hydrolyzing) [Magnetococcales bacterium]|nr:asparagine synthase (glutamine-hydrolyzing) [Magnetococcales bacterium]MBF0322667.1 asparagine synthase (glutamine-hydrolyzing) [Magnetococcales bacterium]